ncbi:MAG: branched-chain amino acid ABC transporter permease [Candidatus Dormibacteraeota bacterium]|nr:branched-chain amino acid ABC transporter permease [Candidatus Dormibacteraeota bacterium]
MSETRRAGAGTRRRAPRWWRPAVWAAVAAVVALIPFGTTSRYYLTVVDQAMLFAIAVLGLYFLLGLTGQLSLAQAAFYGLGAYTAAILATRYHLPIWVNVPAATVTAALFGVLLGIPSLKLRGHYLALTTIGFGIIIQLVFKNWRPVTGGADGIAGIPGTHLFGISFSHPGVFYYIIFGALVLSCLLAWRISRSRMGRAFRAIRENELSAETSGVDSTFYKVVAFALSAAYGGLAGGLYAHWALFIAPETFGFTTSVQMLAMLVIGGSSSIAGTLIGALLLSLLPEALRFLQSGYLAVYGAAIIVLMVFIPDGLWGGLRLLIRKLMGRGKEVPTPLGEELPA